MNKYLYYVNNKPVTKKEMTDKLKKFCYRVVDTQYCGMIGIDTVELDEKKFNKYLRHICDPSYVCITIVDTTFSRRRS